MIKKKPSLRQDTLPALEKPRTAVLAALEKKAQDVTLLDVHAISSFADHFLICTGRSDRQVQSIADGIVETLKREGHAPLGLEGYADGKWILIDCDDLIVHVFHEPVRAFYNLEKLWYAAPRVDLSPWEEESKRHPGP
ncbi:MAG: ribosome silencing factor [Deltaproteobacteria bacterium RBG_13_65_10]|jgi:ribosome-associated protein|nr:MAG: ribosome silencing factor [Deltaproteobacteria bacterium RBG_13_65_10]